MTLPAAGGGYLRMFPMAYTDWVFRKIEESNKERVMVYVHPWEVDPEQPRIRDKMKSRLRHYTNLGKMENRLESLCRNFLFEPLVCGTNREACQIKNSPREAARISNA
jgi:hypothetical protein